MNRISTYSLTVKFINSRFLSIWFGVILVSFYLSSLIFNLPDFLRVILSILWIIYVPFIVGSIAQNICVKLSLEILEFVRQLRFSDLVIRWCLGFFIVITMTYIISILSLSSPPLLGALFLIVPLMINLTSIRNTPMMMINWKSITTLLPVLGISITFGLYVRSNSPYPLTPGFDIFTHMYVIKSFVDNSLFNSPLLYLPTLDMMIGLGSSAFGANLNGIFWVAPILLFCVFGTFVFLIARSLFRSDLYGLLAAVIALSATEMGLASNLQFFYPSSFVMAIFPLSIYVMGRIWSCNSRIWTKCVGSLPLFFLLISVHFQVGFIASIIITSYVLLERLVNKFQLGLFCLKVATLSLAVIVSALYFFGHANYFIYLKGLESGYLFDLSTKIKNLNDWYSPTILILGLIGMYISAFTGSKYILLFGFLASMILFFYFQEIDSIHRVMTLERPLFSLLAVLPIMVLVNGILRILRVNHRSDFLKFRFSREILNFFSPNFLLQPNYNMKMRVRTNIPVFLIVTILLIPYLVSPYDIYMKQYSSYGMIFANSSFDELGTGQWLEKNTPRHYVVYSDPWTVLEMRGLAYRKNIEGIGWNTTVIKLVKDELASNDPAVAYQSITSHFGREVLIVLTPKTSKWLNDLPPLFIQQPSEKFEFFNGFSKFFDEKYFTLIFHTKSSYVFIPNLYLENNNRARDQL